MAERLLLPGLPCLPGHAPSRSNARSWRIASPSTFFLVSTFLLATRRVWTCLANLYASLFNDADTLATYRGILICPFRLNTSPIAAVAAACRRVLYRRLNVAVEPRRGAGGGGTRVSLTILGLASRIDAAPQRQGRWRGAQLAPASAPPRKRARAEQDVLRDPSALARMLPNITQYDIVVS